ncbi:MAG: hypothetical protein VB042_02800 [Victivallaceae bacterium]|nr:hypothetical protein [Victivallaceae bacterium]
MIKIEYLPGAVLTIYLFLTILEYMVSPWNWPTKNPELLYFFVFTVNTVFFLGYWAAIHKRNKSESNDLILNHNFDVGNKWFKVGLIVSVIAIYPRMVTVVGRFDFSLSTMWALFLNGLSNAGVAYSEKVLFHGEDTSSTNALTLLMLALNPLRFFVLTWGIFFWKKYSVMIKLGLLLMIVCEIVSYIIIGTNKGLFELLCWIPFLVAASICSYRDSAGSAHGKVPGAPERPAIKRNLFKKIVLIVLGTCALFSAIGYFSQGQEERRKDYLFKDIGAETNLNMNHVVMRTLPDKLAISYAMLDQYLCQGYYGLDKCLGLNFVYTYGLGNSIFLTYFIGQRFFGAGMAIENSTYPARLELLTGYSSLNRWLSCYSWWAGDLTFPGVIIAVFFVGYALGCAWLDILYQRIPTAFPIFALFAIMVFYFPANNQILYFSGSCIAFLVCFALWLIFRHRGTRRRWSVQEV